MLDAQYFGVPQRRRRVFLVSVFDTATAARCPNPLLPVSESMRRDTPTSGTERQEPARAATQSLGSGSDIANTISASLYHHGTVVNQDANNGHVVVDSPILIDRAAFNQNVNAKYDPHISDNPVTPSLVARGPHAVAAIGFSHTQGLSAQPSETAWPTLRTEGAGMAVAIPIQDGRDMEKHQNGLGIGDEGSPSYTLDQTGAQAVAYGIQGNVIGRQDHNGPAGKGHTDEGDPMFTLTGTDIHAVAYDEYNDTLGGDVHHALRAGTKQSTGVVVDNEIVGTLRSGGDGGVPSSRGEHLVTQSSMAVRRLTPIECERLMGWPDNWTEGQADTHRYKQCGNGVASPVATWIGQQLINL